MHLIPFADETLGKAIALRKDHEECRTVVPHDDDPPTCRTSMVRGWMPSAWPAATLLGLSWQVSTVGCALEREELATPLVDYSYVHACFCETVSTHQAGGPCAYDEHVYLRFPWSGHGGGRG